MHSDEGKVFIMMVISTTARGNPNQWKKKKSGGCVEGIESEVDILGKEVRKSEREEKHINIGIWKTDAFPETVR